MDPILIVIGAVVLLVVFALTLGSVEAISTKEHNKTMARLDEMLSALEREAE